MTTESSKPVNIAANRAAVKWTRRELFGRAVWEVLSVPLFAWTPRPLWAWRRMVLRLFGARIGNAVQVHPTVRIAVPWNLEISDEVGIGDRAIIYCLGHVSIGRGATVSQNAHICAGTHDHRRPDLPLLKPAVKIGAGAWICADAFVGPGVTIGELAIVGARSVTMRDVEPSVIVAGNPARPIGIRRLDS